MICVDELGPLLPRTYPPAPGWSPAGHRHKAPLDYGRGPEKVWIYGALRPRDGQALTCPGTPETALAIGLSSTPLPRPIPVARST
ncbi:MAG: hypothetical protein K0Q71_4664 [Thermomicrobiales bacterium]|nr:hypothetical protein [Ramlibacter sp.]MDF3041958.1 hypothetical protein [Thermomicrobiales bacterium]